MTKSEFLRKHPELAVCTLGISARGVVEWAPGTRCSHSRKPRRASATHDCVSIGNVQPHAVIRKGQNRVTRVHNPPVRALSPISRHDTCKTPDFGVPGTKVASRRVPQICIVLPSGTLAHSTINYIGNTAIILVLRSNAANRLDECCPRVRHLPCDVP